MVQTKVYRAGLALLAAIMLLFTLALTAANAETEILQENAEDAAIQLAALEGTYQPLFQGATFEEKCNDYWHDAAAAVVGESMADTAVALMKYVIGSEAYGEEKVEDAFCCNFIGVDRITFAGNTISGTLNGEAVFSHTYEYIGETYIGEAEGLEGFGGHTFRSIDGNEDEFTYFLLLPDTMGTTYHIEFRYGSDLEALKQYSEGPYANWLAAGIAVEAMAEETEDIGTNDFTLRQVITLFCTENLAEMVNDETEAQRELLVGIWDADEALTEAWRTVYGLPELELYVAYEADGTAATYVNIGEDGAFVPVIAYNYYVYDRAEESTAGLYIAETEEAVTGAPFEITEDGEKLSLFAVDGTATYTKRH